MKAMKRNRLEKAESQAQKLPQPEDISSWHDWLQDWPVEWIIPREWGRTEPTAQEIEQVLAECRAISVALVAGEIEPTTEAIVKRLPFMALSGLAECDLFEGCDD